MQQHGADTSYGPASGQPAHPESPWYRGRRFVTFVIVTGLFLVVGLAYVYTRSPVYQATATVLTKARPAVDAPAVSADTQHVMVEAERLMSEPVLARIAAGAQKAGMSSPPETAELRQALEVKPVPETHLVELQVTGDTPERVKALADTWVEAYLETRARDVAHAVGDTLDKLEEQAAALQAQAEAKRAELEAYRAEHQILSLVQDQNQLPARIKGLNDALAKANERVVNAQARLSALEDAEARGELVAPRGERSELITMVKRFERARTRLAEAEARFTQEYIQLDPKLTALQAEVTDLEEEIAARKQAARETVFSDARQELDEAREAARRLQGEIEGLKASQAEYTARFAEHETLQADLGNLEQLHRETRSRLASLVAQNRQRYPQVELLRPAALPTSPVSPDYARDTLIAIVAALVLGLVAAAIVEFLAPRPPGPGTTNLTGIRVYLDGTAAGPRLPEDGPRRVLPPGRPE